MLVFVDRQPREADPLPAGYRVLLGRLLDVAADDDRVRAVWLSGSVGRGVADAGSDLDVVLAVADEAFEEFAASWRAWLALVTPTVLARELPGLPGSWHSLTPGCERFDVVTQRASAALRAGSRRRELVLAKDEEPGTPAGEGAGHPQPAAAEQAAGPDPAEQAAGPDPAEQAAGPDPAEQAAGPDPAEQAAGPDPATLTGIVEEFLRQQAIFPAAVVARSDWLLGVQGIQQVHLMLYQLFVESNQPLPPMGVKQWSAKLTPAQREVCAALPSPRADRHSVLAAMRAAASAFRDQARPILAGHGAPWPDGLDAAVLKYQASELGW
jgi:hypothetical protein